MANERGKLPGCPDATGATAMAATPFPSEEIMVAARMLARLIETPSSMPPALTELASGLRSSAGTLRRVFRALCRSGLVRVDSASGGRVALGCEPGELTLERVVLAVDPAGEQDCLLLRAACGSSRNCSLNAVWRSARTAALVEMRSTSIGGGAR